MILADKISELRRQNGWSQEELAEMLDVSRQSVSKWESGNSVPDLNRIIKLSEVFGVSTDYLVKDDAPKDQIVVVDSGSSPEYRNVDLAEASAYMDLAADAAYKIGLGVALCIMSPAVLITLAGFSENSSFISENLAAGIGVTVLLLLVAAAVLIFVSTSMKMSRYDYLDQEPISLDYGVEGVVLKRKEEFADVHRRCITLGVVLCILSAVPVVLLGCLNAPDHIICIVVSLLLLMVAIAVYLFVLASNIQGSYQKLLQEGDYTIRKKTIEKRSDWISSAYWCTCVAIYLGISFLTNRWEITWVIWPVAALFFGAVKAFMSAKFGREYDREG